MASPFDEPARPGVIRVRLGLLWLGVVLVVVVGLCGAYWFLRHGGLATVNEWVDKDQAPWPSWMPGGKQQVSYQVPPLETNHLGIAARDTQADAIDALRAELKEQRQLIEALKNRPVPPPSAAVKPEPPKVKVSPPTSLVLLAAKEPSDKAAEGTGLTAGTVINCTLKFAINSERQTVVVAIVREHIRDTRNPKLILMPQFSKVILDTDPTQLIAGEERVDITLARIELPDRQTIELPKEPVVDQIGQGGLTGKVDRKWRYVLPALLLRGVFAASVSQVTTVGGTALQGLQADGRQIGQKVTEPYINSKPVIRISEGERCAVVLTKDLVLPEYRF